MESMSGTVAEAGRACSTTLVGLGPRGLSLGPG